MAPVIIIFNFSSTKNPDIAFNIKFSKLKTINRREYTVESTTEHSKHPLDKILLNQTN